MVREQDRGKPHFNELPCAVQSFEQLREGGYRYVDKTDLIWKIAHGSLVQFFARPRRFGKSLMISTLKSYFEGRGDLFEGLKVEALREEAGETEWVKYPTFTFGFSASSFNREEAILGIFNRFMQPYEQEYGLSPNGLIGDRLATLIRTAYERDGLRPVILVDEYDNPLTDTLAEKDRELHLHYKKELRGFYKAIKESTDMLRFVMITGITRFHDLSLFSGINQMVNVSMDEDLATLAGITEEELRETFAEEIQGLASKRNTDFEGALSILREYYDGYRFTPAEVHVYNPQSLIFAFRKYVLSGYWAQTGTSQLLATVFPSYDYDFSLLQEEVDSSMDELSLLDASGENPIPLLFQSGYLTIADCDLDGSLALRFPNREVRTAFWEVVLPLYGPKGTSRLVPTFRRRLLKEDVPAAMEQIRGMVAGVAYSTMARKRVEEEGGNGREGLYEELFQTALYAWFSALGLQVRTEVHSLKGRSDVEVYLGNTVYIFELKVGPMRESAQDALTQIKAQGYAEKHRGSGLSVVLIGASIDTRAETRGQMEWVMEGPIASSK